MLRVYAETYIHLGQAIAGTEVLFSIKDAVPESDLPAKNLSPKDLKHLSDTLGKMEHLCEQLGLTVCWAESVRGCLIHLAVVVKCKC